jgi:hypothetical protein
MIFFLFFFVSKSREKRRDERGQKRGCVCVRNVGKFEENCWEKNAREGKIYM